MYKKRREERSTLRRTESEIYSVADPDPGYGAFLTPGSGIQDG
jgi:hypothetical protein